MRFFPFIACLFIVAAQASAQMPRLPQLEPFDVLNPPRFHLPLQPMEHTPADPAAVLRGFIKHIESDRAIPTNLRQPLVKVLKEADPAEQPDIMTDALMRLSPPFHGALEDLAMEKTNAALATLDRLSKSGDPYLAAHADFFAARAHLQREDFESARPLLKKMLDQHLPHTLYGGEAMFMLGVCHAELLERDRALATLSLFLEHYPQASERMAIGARHLIDELAVIADGTIIDVSDRMDYSRRRLQLQRTAQVTQQEQQNIIRLLDALIEEAEQKENSGGGGGGGGGGQGMGPAQGSGNPSSPAQESTAPVGQAQMGQLHRVQRGRPEEQWGQARKKEIDAVISSPDSKIPNHYRELIEQYYRSMQKQGSTP